MNERNTSQQRLGYQHKRSIPSAVSMGRPMAFRSLLAIAALAPLLATGCSPKHQAIAPANEPVATLDSAPMVSHAAARERAEHDFPPAPEADSSPAKAESDDSPILASPTCFTPRGLPPNTKRPSAPGAIANATCVLRAMEPAFMACYRAGLKTDPSLGGKVMVLAKVEGAKVTEITSPESSLSAIVPCLQSVVRRGQFSQPAGGQTSLAIPIKFVNTSR